MQQDNNIMKHVNLYVFLVNYYFAGNGRTYKGLEPK